MSNLMNFYGLECPHCERMEPLMAQLEKETGVAVDRIEVWHNEDNAKKLESLDKDGACGGVPFFINTETGKTICGEATYEELKTWAGK
jgi:thiol-disulfide isomerase/thioredoxin